MQNADIIATVCDPLFRGATLSAVRRACDHYREYSSVTATSKYGDLDGRPLQSNQWSLHHVR